MAVKRLAVLAVLYFLALAVQKSFSIKVIESHTPRLLSGVAELKGVNLQVWKKNKSYNPTYSNV